VRRGKLVDVKPDVLWPCVFNQLFIWDATVSQDVYANVEE